MITKEQWHRLIDEQAGSGLNQSNFCKQKGISAKTFSARRSELKKEGLGDISKKPMFVRANKIDVILDNSSVELLSLRISRKSDFKIEFPLKSLKAVLKELNSIEADK